MSHALRLLALLVSALFSAEAAHAGRIAELFSDGIFGLTWGASSADIEAAFPGGKWQKILGARIYWVNDTRPVLNMERGKKSRIGFALNSEEKLNGITVEYVPGGLSKWGEIIQKSQEAFGPYLDTDDEAAIAGTILLQWADDEGVKVVIANSPGFGRGPITLNVSKINFGPSKSKEELGFK